MAVKVSGFSYIHNAIVGGYPLEEAVHSIYDYVDEMVIVDCQSTDDTRRLLERLGVRIIDGKWGNDAGATLAAAHALHRECSGDIIVHFEADEVFDSDLIREVSVMIEMGYHDLAVWRLQICQNFQRCRWYPELVHRVFPKGSVSKEGHTTTRHNEAVAVDPKWGFLWDCTNIFRDNWKTRFQQQAELWGHSEPLYRRVPLHFLQEPTDFDTEAFLNEPHWEWTTTPFNIPEILKPLVGKTRYSVNI